MTDTEDDASDQAEPDGLDSILVDLFAVIERRQADLPTDSYTASLLTHEKGVNAILEKLGEETTELVLAAKDGESAEIAAEAADLVYHLLVLLAAEEMDLTDLATELRGRFPDD